MGKKGKWFGVVKKVFSPEPKEKKVDEQRSERLNSVVQSSALTTEPVNAPCVPPSLQFVEAELVETTIHNDNEIISPLETSNTGDEDAVPRATEKVVVPQTNISLLSGKSREEAAAIMIQTTFRGHQARKAVRSLKGLVRLQCLVDGDSAKRQVTATLRCMQTLSRVQSQIQSRRIQLTEKKQAIQRLRREQELEALKEYIVDEWDDSLQTKEQVDASLMSKHEAAVRRERAMAYSFSHQRKNSLKSGYPLFTDLNNPHWEWSFTERLATTKSDKEQSNDQALAKIDSLGGGDKIDSLGGGDIANAYGQREVNPDVNSPTGIQNTDQSTTVSNQINVIIPSRKQAHSTKVVKSGRRSAHILPQDDDEPRSIPGIVPEANRRHSVSGSMMRDDEGVLGSSTTPNFMTLTKSAMAKTRLHSPSTENMDGGTLERLPSAKKKFSLTHAADKHKISSLARRHSGPPKFNNVSSSARVVHSDHSVAGIVEM